jgi:CRP-like cAMP-binding protein
MLVDRDALILTLSGHRSFSGLGPEAWQSFLDVAEVVSFSPEEVVYESADEAGHGYLLVQGRLELVEEPYPGRRLCTQIFSAGTLFSEGGFVNPWPARRCCTALESSEALRIPSENFLRIVDEGNPVALCIIDRLLDAFVLEVETANQRLDEIYGRPDRTLRRLRSLG